MDKSCPCFSGKSYVDCCEKYHMGTFPENALLLMRSRYSAYALNLSTYTIETTAMNSSEYQSDKKEWQKKTEQFSNQISFVGLKIIKFQEKESSAFVSFIAYLTRSGEDVSFSEKSLFEKTDRWRYVKALDYQVISATEN